MNCSCVKNGLPCQSCLPSRLGNCVNTVCSQPVGSATRMQPAFPPASSTSNSMSHTTRPLLSPFQTHSSPPQDSPSQTNSQPPSATLNSQPQRSADSEFSSFFPFYLLSFLYLFLSFLYPFLCTSLHSALSGVESGASFAITEGPAH